MKFALETITTHELRMMLGKQSMRSWYRLIADAKKAKLGSVKNPFEVINKNLTNFEPLKLIDFQEDMINNDKYTYE